MKVIVLFVGFFVASLISGCSTYNSKEPVPYSIRKIEKTEGEVAYQKAVADYYANLFADRPDLLARTPRHPDIWK